MMKTSERELHDDILEISELALTFERVLLSR